MNDDLVVREDWHLLMQKDGLAQVAGVSPANLLLVALKELADNGLDAGSKVTVTLSEDDTACTIADDGDGLDPEEVLALFDAQRPLASSKLWRRAGRGAIGNGLRVVAGVAATYGATITTVSRGTRLIFRISDITGRPDDIEREPAAGEGFAVTLHVPGANLETAAGWADDAACFPGRTLEGKADPRWFDADALHEFALAAPDVPVVRLLSENIALANAGRAALREQFGNRTIGSLSKVERKGCLAIMHAHPGRVKALAGLGEAATDVEGEGTGYARVAGEIEVGGAVMPAIVEVWASATRRVSRDASAHANFGLLLMNRTPALTSASAFVSNGTLCLNVGGKIVVSADLPKTFSYNVALAVAAPKVPILSHGKAPDLAPFRSLANEALGKAARAAARDAGPVPKDDAIKAMCFEFMPEAYAKVSDDGRLPANARQMMYAVRAMVTAAGGRWFKNDASFTAGVLPEFMATFPELTADWKILYDPRGSLTVPHEGRQVALGTKAVDGYRSETPLPDTGSYSFSPVVYRAPRRERMSGLLSVEKEGFAALLDAAQIGARFDVGILGAKGHSTQAAREVVDAFVADELPVVIVTDFDVDGIEIARVYAEGSWRDGHTKRPVIRAGLRLADVEAMGLEAEPLDATGPGADRRRAVLARLAKDGEITEEEAEFLAERRVELNAMTSRQMVDWLEEVLTREGFGKVLPENGALTAAWARSRRAQAVEAALAEAEAEIAADAALVAAPGDLEAMVAALLDEQPALSWDEAVDRICRREA